MRKIWAFFWYQNLGTFDKNPKQSDQAPLSVNPRLTKGKGGYHPKGFFSWYSKTFYFKQNDFNNCPGIQYGHFDAKMGCIGPSTGVE